MRARNGGPRPSAWWSFLWGIPGAFIGVPVTIAMPTMCDQYAATGWLAVLLSDSASRK
jgi:AI-2 transport protein TqsA